MSQKIPSFEHDYQKKIMVQHFPEPCHLTSTGEVQAWRSAWMTALSSWHSPYKVLVDCTHLTLTPGPEITQALDLMVRFFNGFFLRKIVGFGRQEGAGHESLPFPVFASQEEAELELGIRVRVSREPTDFRSLIQFQNHFQQHTIELSFSQPVVITTKEEVATLRSKLSNNLMQWHSKWNLLIDCANLEVQGDAVTAMEKLWVVMSGFFMKEVIGYAPKATVESYPFKVYRSRHKAAQHLEAEGAFSGDKADCKSRKT